MLSLAISVPFPWLPLPRTAKRIKLAQVVLDNAQHFARHFWRGHFIDVFFDGYLHAVADLAQANLITLGAGFNFFLGRFAAEKAGQEEVEARAQRYQVRLSKVGDSVQVTVEENINKVAPPEVARKVLGVIQDNLG